MEQKKLLEAGKIVGTHGIRGEVKVKPWDDSPELLLSVPRVFICEQPIKIKSARAHKCMALLLLEGFESMNMAFGLQGQVISVSREDVALPKDKYFVRDIIGFSVVDIETGKSLGNLKDVLEYPSSRIFETDATPPLLIPDVPEFIKKVDIEQGVILVRLIEGM